MNSRSLLAPFHSLQNRVETIEMVMSKRSNALLFLVIRFLLMSAMVVAFTWSALELNP